MYAQENIGMCVTSASLLTNVNILLRWKSRVQCFQQNYDLFCLGSSSATSGSTIIGENTGVFVGGLPQGYAIVRRDEGECNCSLYYVVYMES